MIVVSFDLKEDLVIGTKAEFFLKKLSIYMKQEREKNIIICPA